VGKVDRELCCRLTEFSGLHWNRQEIFSFIVFCTLRDVLVYDQRPVAVPGKDVQAESAGRDPRVADDKRDGSKQEHRAACRPQLAGGKPFLQIGRWPLVPHAQFLPLRKGATAGETLRVSVMAVTGFPPRSFWVPKRIWASSASAATAFLIIALFLHMSRTLVKDLARGTPRGLG